jgi:formiminotetrahydrofolate cyclodeaminase
LVIEGVSVTDATTRTISDYASAVASGEPTPGGGSVIATVAAFAAGLAEMVCHLTLSRPVEPQVSEALTDAKTTAAQLRSRFLELASEDEHAYGAYREAARLPKATAEERESRRDALEAALVGSADVPLQMASSCVELLAALEAVGSLGTKHARADVQTSLRLAEAALKSAVTMVRANTDLMRDREQATKLDQEIERLLSGGEQAIVAVTRTLTRQSE